MSSDNPTPRPTNSPALNNEDAARLTVAVANLTALGLPLATGLRALAEETPGTSLAVAMNLLADEIAAGVPFDQAMKKLEHQFPPHLRGLISVGLRTGELGETLADFATRQRAMRARRRRLRQSLAYPVILFLCSLPVLLFMVFFLMPQMKSIYDDFELQLPDLTVFVFAAIESTTVVVFALLALVGIALIFGRWWLRFRIVDRLFGSIPLLGPAYVWSRVANFSQVLGTLVEHHVPLPEALQYTADAVPGSGLQSESRRLSESVARGSSLSGAMEEKALFPPLLTAFVTSGERAGRLSAGLLAAGDYAGAQVDRYSERIRLLLPLIVFTTVLFLEGSLYFAMLAPMVSLISSLTG